MFAGVAFVVFFVAGVVLDFGNSPELKSSDTPGSAAHKWLAELSTSEHRIGLIIAAYLLVVSAIAFVWFCNGMREWLAMDQTWGRAVSGLGVLGAAAIGIGALMGGAGAAGAVEFGSNPLPQSGDSIRVVAELLFPLLFVLFGLVSACIIGTLSTAARRSGQLPGWLSAGGWLAALAAIGGVIFFPFILTLLWYLLVAIFGARRAGAGRPGSPPAQEHAGAV
jgi:hypothetical protein